MKKYSPVLLSTLLLSSMMIAAPLVQADDSSSLIIREQELNMREQALNNRQKESKPKNTKEQELDARERELDKREEQMDNREPKTYGKTIGKKALTGIASIGTAPLEIPKAIINVTNQSNVAFGFIGGSVKGILNTVGRFIGGSIDLATFFIPTDPIAKPDYVWQDFYHNGSYGDVFHVDNATEEEPEAEVSAAPAEETTTNTVEQDNIKRDRMFKRAMMK